jgi:hypothetical protein
LVEGEYIFTFGLLGSTKLILGLLNAKRTRLEGILHSGWDNRLTHADPSSCIPTGNTEGSGSHDGSLEESLAVILDLMPLFFTASPCARSWGKDSGRATARITHIPTLISSPFVELLQLTDASSEKTDAF